MEGLREKKPGIGGSLSCIKTPSTFFFFFFLLFPFSFLLFFSFHNSCECYVNITCTDLSFKVKLKS